METLEKVLLSAVAVSVVGLIFKIVWEWLRERNNNHKNNSKKQLIKMMERIEGKIDNLEKGKLERMEDCLMRLIEIYSKTDNDGVPLCYHPRGWKESIDRMSQNIDKMNILFEKWLDRMERFVKPKNN